MRILVTKYIIVDILLFFVILNLSACAAKSGCADKSGGDASVNLPNEPTLLSIQSAPVQAVSLPQFPWPPPDASAFAKIPSTFLQANVGAKTALQHVAEKLEAAFNQTGYSQKKYYQVPNGFALVSQLEQFRPDGSSKQEPDRWAAEFRPPKIFSLTSYIKAIFKANPGRYRIVAFIVTSQPFEESKESITREEARGWLDKGMVVLPKSIGEQAYTDEHYCTALIYEFELPENGKEAVFRTSSNLTGRDHLKKSKLWAALER